MTENGDIFFMLHESNPVGQTLQILRLRRQALIGSLQLHEA